MKNDFFMLFYVKTPQTISETVFGVRTSLQAVLERFHGVLCLDHHPTIKTTKTNIFT